MRRIGNKQNKLQSITRANSHAHFTYSQNKTLAELNQVSNRHNQFFQFRKPPRIILPEYFNIPKFQDHPLHIYQDGQVNNQNKLRSEAAMNRKLKDLVILAEGMRRAKNIKEQSRCYYTQGVLYHNMGLLEASIASFQKFLKIVLFIKDQKSIELALNAIGTQYMYLQQPQKALEYHQKQREIDRCDPFFSHVNCGICYEMTERWTDAQKQYQQAFNEVNKQKNSNRYHLIVEQMRNLETKLPNGKAIYLTQQKHEPKLPVNLFSNRTHQKQEKSRQKFTSRINQAISNAQENMSSYINSMKNSFILE